MRETQGAQLDVRGHGGRRVRRMARAREENVGLRQVRRPRLTARRPCVYYRGRVFRLSRRVVTNVFLVLYQLGSSSVYVVFKAKNLKAVSERPTRAGYRHASVTPAVVSFTGRGHLHGRDDRRTDVHGVPAGAVDRHHLGQEPEASRPVLVDRHVPDHR